MSDEVDPEEVLYETRPSRKRFIIEYLVSIVLITISFLLYYYRPLPLNIGSNYLYPNILLSVALIFTSFILISYSEFRRLIEKYILTDYAVFEKIGLINKRMTNLPYIKLERCDLEEPLVERMVGIGDVRVDAGKDFFIIKGVNNPSEVRDIIRSQMRRVMGGDNKTASVHD